MLPCLADWLPSVLCALVQALLPKLRDGSSAVASSVLATLGELSVVGAEAMRPFLPDLLPLIVDTVQQQTPGIKQVHNQKHSHLPYVM